MEQDCVVIDATLWLHAFQKGKHDRFIKLAADFNIIICTCPELTDEVCRNLLHNPYFKKTINNPQEHIDFFEEVTFNQTIEKRFDRAAGLKDNFLFDLAYTVKSFHIVTSETRLLNMKQVNKIQIVSPTAYFGMFNIAW